MPQNIRVPRTGKFFSKPLVNIIDQAGMQGEAVMSELLPRYAQFMSEGASHFAANQAAQAVSAALTVTYTGLCVSNPAGSGSLLIVKKAGFVLTAAPAAIASMGLITGWASTGITAHTTPLANFPQSTLVGNTPQTKALVDSACTLVGTPTWSIPLKGGFTAAALYGDASPIIDVEGMIGLLPGGYVAIGALTAVTGIGFLSWDDVPMPS